jgi:hypothetical protein
VPEPHAAREPRCGHPCHIPSYRVIYNIRFYTVTIEKHFSQTSLVSTRRVSTYVTYNDLLVLIFVQQSERKLIYWSNVNLRMNKPLRIAM